jgi:hypothetical protein
MAMRTGKRSHYKWDEIQPRHFHALALSLPDPNAWQAMLRMTQAIPGAIASVSKRLPADFKESVWSTTTKGLTKKADEFLRVGEKLDG